MSTKILESRTDTFNSDTGEITSTVKHTVHKSTLSETDQFFKVSKYLNVIFAYNEIPLRLVPISLLMAQRMTFKTNILYLQKADKEEMADMLDISYVRVAQLIQECKRYDIIRPIPGYKAKYEVNAFLFSTGSIAETRELQAHFNFLSGDLVAQAEQKSRITGEVVRIAVADDRNKRNKGEIAGQLTLEDFQNE